jgi:hypothetical protein
MLACDINFALVTTLFLELDKQLIHNLYAALALHLDNKATKS